jgi:hypothetical protein
MLLRWCEVEVLWAGISEVRLNGMDWTRSMYRLVGVPSIWYENEGVTLSEVEWGAVLLIGVVWLGVKTHANTEWVWGWMKWICGWRCEWVKWSDDAESMWGCWGCWRWNDVKWGGVTCDVCIVTLHEANNVWGKRTN